MTKHNIEFVTSEENLTTPSSTINYKTNDFKALLLFAGTTFTIFIADNVLKETISMEKDIQIEILDTYKILDNDSIYIDQEDYSKILTNVVKEMLSNTEDFSDINQHINDNFWDLV